MINNKLLDLMTLSYLQTPLQRGWRPPPSFHRQESLSEPSGSSIKWKQRRTHCDAAMQSWASCTPWCQEGVAWDSGNRPLGLRGATTTTSTTSSTAATTPAPAAIPGATIATPTTKLLLLVVVAAQLLLLQCMSDCILLATSQSLEAQATFRSPKRPLLGGPSNPLLTSTY